MAIAIRSPIRGNSIRNPDMAILSIVAPGAMIVEIFVANHIRRDILR
jgi:hypothetical protein